MWPKTFFKGRQFRTQLSHLLQKANSEQKEPLISLQKKTPTNSHEEVGCSRSDTDSESLEHGKKKTLGENKPYGRREMALSRGSPVKKEPPETSPYAIVNFPIFDENNRAGETGHQKHQDGVQKLGKSVTIGDEEYGVR